MCIVGRTAVEAYHQLRSALAQADGKRELIGRTELDIAISNECDRLVANMVVAYNSMLLSGLLNRYHSDGDREALEMLKRISPIAWQHIHPFPYDTAQAASATTYRCGHVAQFHFL